MTTRFDAATVAYLLTIIEWYGKVAFTHNYIFGWIDGNDVKMVFLDWNEFKRALKFDRAAQSKGGMLKIRVKPDSKVKAAWNKKAIVIANADELTEDNKYNKGENFERIITEKLCGEQWTKDKIPFTVAGDVIYKGISYQVKLDNAELTNEKTYKNFNRG